MTTWPSHIAVRRNPEHTGSAKVSPVVWQHISFYGRYEFTTGPDRIDVDAMVEVLTQTPIVPVEEEE